MEDDIHLANTDVLLLNILLTANKFSKQRYKLPMISLAAPFSFVGTSDEKISIPSLPRGPGFNFQGL
jgi:hypothetical protein